jgi:hypothetical protein
MGDDIIPIRPPHVIDEAGGPVDEISISLAIYGNQLDPEAVSARLGCAPTHAHRKGESRKPGGHPSRTGAWLLQVRGVGVREADTFVELLLARLPADEAFWSALRQDYTVQIRIGLHMDRWNQGFELSSSSVHRFAVTGAPVLFDVYSYADDSDDVED